MLLELIMIQSMWFSGDFSRHYFIISPPGLASSFPAYQNFSKGASKSCVSIFFIRLLHRPRPLPGTQRVSIPVNRKNLAARIWGMFWYKSKIPVLFGLMVQIDHQGGAVVKTPPPRNFWCGLSELV